MQRRWWTKLTLPLALVAMLAMFVSPVLAFDCCCQPVPAVHAAEQSVATVEGDCCHPAVVVAPPACHGESAIVQAQVSNSHSCNCAHLENQPYLSSDSKLFAAVAIATLGQPLRAYTLQVQLTERPVHFITADARPRGPNRSHTSSRAPPAFALS